MSCDCIFIFFSCRVPITAFPVLKTRCTVTIKTFRGIELINKSCNL
uniref:Uncharacterized protein n=1 Tax=Amphimedon queenslandica TaxID=400682 RepID=A0A1X7TNF7_AMPQE